jgi:hypothetical protein
VNGAPATWGAIVFTPEDAVAPIASARVMNGKFQLNARDGAVLGKNKLRITFSSAVLPSLTDAQAPTGVLTTTKMGGDATEDLTFEVKEGANKLALELKWP